MRFSKDVLNFFNNTLHFKYDKGHRALYENINYFVNKFNLHKSKTSKLSLFAEEVDYSVIEKGINNLSGGSFCSKTIYKKILSYRNIYKSYHFGYEYNGTKFHYYFYSKKPPAKGFLNKLVIITNVLSDDCSKLPKKVSILFCDTQFKKKLPKKGVIGVHEVNTGMTTFVNDNERIINIWRREERIKVYIHELLHAFNVENSILNDVLDGAQPIMKKFNVDIPLVLLGEAYVETWATFLNIISHYAIGRSKKPDESLIAKAFSLEVEWSTYQVAKLLHYYGYNSVSKIYNRSGKFKSGGKWDEDTNVFSYYIIKWGLLSNICKFFDLCDKKNRLPCNIDKSKYNDFLEIPLLSWNKRRFTTVINKHIREMVNKRKRYKHIGYTLRMTVHD